MKINNLNFLLIVAFCLVIPLQSETQCMEGDEILDRNSRNLGDRGVVRLIAEQNYPTTKILDLNSNEIKYDGAKAVISAILEGKFQALNELRLRYNKIYDGGLTVIAGSTFHALKTLDLAHNLIDADGAADIASGNFPALERLDLEDNLLKDDGVRTIAGAIGSGKFPALTTLILEYNEINKAGAIALAGRGSTTLRILSLKGNTIKDEGAEAFEHGNFPALTNLNLEENDIENPEVIRRKINKNLTGLTVNLGKQSK